MQQQKMIEQMQQNRSKTIKEPITCSESNVSVEPTECVENNVCEETTVITYLIGENNVEASNLLGSDDSPPIINKKPTILIANPISNNL